MSLQRRSAVPALLARPEDYLIVSGLGSASKDLHALVGPAPNLFPMFGAMGAAAMIGLGLALARPDRRALVVTGEGELLMNLGALATIAVQAPGNLALLCVDNGTYLETGGQESHTARTVDLEAVARGCGLREVMSVREERSLAPAEALLRRAPGPVFVLLRVDASEPPNAIRDMDPARCRVRFQSALAHRPPPAADVSSGGDGHRKPSA